jgi:SAM-dependent methyltransferase
MPFDTTAGRDGESDRRDATSGPTADARPGDPAAEEGAFARATGRVADEEGGVDKPRYRRYQYDLIAPHCGRSVLEVGAGLGEFAAQFTGLERLVVTDVDPQAVALLKRRFDDRPEVEARQLDLSAELHLDEPVESVIAINVLEHFDDDAALLRSLAGLVRPGGSIVLWVPGYQALYGDFDRKVGHFRRYTPSTLADAVRRAGLTVGLCRPVNLLGGLAWWAAVRKGGTGAPNPRLVGIYDRYLVPVTRVLDRVPVPFGQSILGVAHVP